MFRHKEPLIEKPQKNTVSSPSDLKQSNPVSSETVKSEASLKELMEKNLKWSQIIYEQNRKINNKLLWAAIFSWLKIIIIVGSIVWVIIYLQPMFKNVWAQYNELMGGAAAAEGASQPGSLESLFKFFNLDPAKQEQLKTLFK